MKDFTLKLEVRSGMKDSKPPAMNERLHKYKRQTCWLIIPRIFAVNKEEEHNQMRRRSVGVASKARLYLLLKIFRFTTITDYLSKDSCNRIRSFSFQKFNPNKFTKNINTNKNPVLTVISTTTRTHINKIHLSRIIYAVYNYLISWKLSPSEPMFRIRAVSFHPLSYSSFVFMYHYSSFFL